MRPERDGRDSRERPTLVDSSPGSILAYTQTHTSDTTHVALESGLHTITHTHAKLAPNSKRLKHETLKRVGQTFVTQDLVFDLGARAPRETALAPSAPRARRLPASSRVPPQCHIWCAGHVQRRQRGQLGHAGGDLRLTPFRGSLSKCAPTVTLRTRALQTRCQAPR